MLSMAMPAKIMPAAPKRASIPAPRVLQASMKIMTERATVSPSSTAWACV